MSSNPIILQSEKLTKVGLSYKHYFFLGFHFHKLFNPTTMLWQYILETSVYPREAETLKELRNATATHPW